MVNLINDTKRQYLIWANPFELARKLKVSITTGKLGPAQEGAAFVENIVYNGPKISDSGIR
jgi:hypothetical protein